MNAHVSHKTSKKKLEADGRGDPDFIDRCNGTIHRMIKKGGNKYLCCIDGSEAAHLAYQFMMSLLRPNDSVLLFHSYRAKQIEDMEYNPDDVLRRYTQHMTASLLPPSQYEFVWSERGMDQSVLESLQKHLSTYEYSWEAPRPKVPPDFVVIGQHGRLQVPQKSPSTLGTIADLALRTVHVPCIVAKKYITNGPRKFVFFVNGSLCSRVGFEIIVQMVRSLDIFTLVHVLRNVEEEETTEEEDEAVRKIREYYEDALDKYGPRVCSFVATHIKEGQTVKERMVEYVTSDEPDLMALAPRAKDFLSSTTDYVISNVPCSMILCKN